MFYRVDKLPVMSGLRHPVVMSQRIYFSTAAQILQLSLLVAQCELESIQVRGDRSTHYFSTQFGGEAVLRVNEQTEVLHVSANEYWYTAKLMDTDLELVGARLPIEPLVNYHKLVVPKLIAYAVVVTMAIGREHHWSGNAQNEGHAAVLASASASQVFPGEVVDILVKQTTVQA